MIPSNLVVSTLLNHLSICEQVLDKSKSGHEIAVCVWGAKLYNHQSLGVDQALKNAENADIAFHAPLLHFISRETERVIAKAQFEQLPECHRVMAEACWVTDMHCKINHFDESPSFRCYVYFYWWTYSYDSTWLLNAALLYSAARVSIINTKTSHEHYWSSQDSLQASKLQPMHSVRHQSLDAHVLKDRRNERKCRPIRILL